MKHASATIAVVSMIGLVGCTSTAGDPVDPLPGSGVEVTEGYPEGPYGTNKGSTISDYAFPGYPRPAEGLDDKTLMVRLNDFYNPTGEDVYPEGSPYGEGRPKPTALLLTVGAGWCGPCRQEAAQLLPVHYAELAPEGLEIVVVIAETHEPGVVAGFSELDGWIIQYEVNYVAVIDPERQVGALFDAAAFPGNALIDTRTMTIVENIQGAPQDSFWTAADGVLNE